MDQQLHCVCSWIDNWTRYKYTLNWLFCLHLDKLQTSQESQESHKTLILFRNQLLKTLLTTTECHVKCSLFLVNTNSSSLRKRFVTTDWICKCTLHSAGAALHSGSSTHSYYALLVGLLGLFRSETGCRFGTQIWNCLKDDFVLALDMS